MFQDVVCEQDWGFSGRAFARAAVWNGLRASDATCGGQEVVGLTATLVSFGVVKGVDSTFARADTIN